MLEGEKNNVGTREQSGRGLEKYVFPGFLRKEGGAIQWNFIEVRGERGGLACVRVGVCCRFLLREGRSYFGLEDCGLELEVENCLF